jgi:hypothetical protein
LSNEIKLCPRTCLENQILFQETIYEEEETLTMFPSINIACAQTLMGLMEQTTMIEESISNVQYFMPLVESLSKKCADGYLSTIEAVMHARLPCVRSPSPEELCSRADEYQAIQHKHHDFIETAMPDQCFPETDLNFVAKRGRKNKAQNTRKGKEPKSRSLSGVGPQTKESYVAGSAGISKGHRAATRVYQSNDQIPNTSQREMKGRSTGGEYSSGRVQQRSWNFDLEPRSEIQYDEFEQPQSGSVYFEAEYAQQESFDQVSFEPEPGAFSCEADHLNLPYASEPQDHHYEHSCSTFKDPENHHYDEYYEESGHSAQNSHWRQTSFQVKCNLFFQSHI